MRAAPDLDAARALLLEPAFEPAAEAVVTAPPAAAAPDALPARGEDAVALAEDGAERVLLRARCGARCLVALTDLDYSGWRAAVDGREAPILLANAIFRGVWLEPGAHEIEFRCAPASFRAGLAIFAATLVAIGALAVADRRGRLGP